MTDNRCKRSMSISLNGDGCRYCQPQELIDRLIDDLTDQQASIETMEEMLTIVYKELRVKDLVPSTRRMIRKLLGVIE